MRKRLREQLPVRSWFDWAARIVFLVVLGLMAVMSRGWIGKLIFVVFLVIEVASATGMIQKRRIPPSR